MQQAFLNALVAISICLHALQANGQEVVADPADDVAQIKAAVESYVAAFNSKDAEKLAAEAA